MWADQQIREDPKMAYTSSALSVNPTTRKISIKKANKIKQRWT
jgi:hypothetical protein